MRSAALSLFAGLLLAPLAGGQEKPEAKSKPEEERPPAGQMSAAARRNENVAVYHIDNNAIKEANIRLGSSITLIPDPTVEKSYFGSEFGRSASSPVILAGLARRSSWHGEAFWRHQNGLFNARTFFQVGDVKPSHRNQYGGRFSFRINDKTYLSGDIGGRKILGMVNGNVLVPLANERIPTASDPDVYAEVARYLEAFPNELPNRPDFDQRALNTNAPQRIDQLQGTLRLDRDVTSRGRLSLFYNFSRMTEDAFQLVAGMNPDTEIHTHRARATYTAAISPQTEISAGIGFDRSRSVLLPEPNAVGPRVRFGFQIQELGPDAEFPVDRVLNTYRGGVNVRRLLSGDAHTLTFGGELFRNQLNSSETRDERGYFYFGNKGGQTAIENFLDGLPSSYKISLGNFHRGFRDSAGNLYVADLWRLRPGLQLYFGLRYSFLGRPTEVDNLDQISYSCDCNNFAPRLALAWQFANEWVLRTSYAISYGGIQPVTYQQVRNNLPLVRYVSVQTPDFLDPLRDLDLDDPSGRSVPTWLSDRLVSPYVHQYNVSFERQLARRTSFRAAYIGSRGVKLLNSFTQNRGEPVPGIPLTLRTVDQRRPDPRYYDTFLIVNGGLAYFNAAQGSLESSPLTGLTLAATYTLSKSIDEGPDYTATAANRDLLGRRHQWQYESFKDRRGLSNFDTTHSLLFTYVYELPQPVRSGGFAAAVLNDWQLAGAVLYKTGTPFTLFVGSDAPGFGNVDGGSGDRPNIIDPSILGATVSHPDTATTILSRDNFDYLALGSHRGNTARNAFRKATIGNWNASLNKIWKFDAGRECTLVFRAEAYNITNTPQFDEPQRNISSPSFGKITNTLNDGRVLQFGLRLIL